MQISTAWRPDSTGVERVACPLCGGRSFQQLATTDRYDMGLVTAGCQTCGLVMSNPQPTTQALDTFYRDHYRHYYQKTDEPSLAYIREYRKDERAAATAGFLQSRGLVKADTTVLDIGASEGCILKAVADLAPTSRRFAVEPNARFGAFAVQHAGCTLYDALETFVAAPPAALDLVVINHVYEHVKDPVSFLASLRPLMAPAGRVYIDVPDVTEYRKLDSLHIAHLYHFSADTLARAALRAGFEVELIEKHRPLKHPKSLRCLLRLPAQVVTVPAPHNRQEGWTAVRRANRQAWRAHRRHWSWPQRLRHLFS